MNHKKLKKLDECQDNPHGYWRLMVEEQMKTNTRLAYLMALIAVGGTVGFSLLFLILDKVTGG